MGGLSKVAVRTVRDEYTRTDLLRVLFSINLGKVVIWIYLVVGHVYQESIQRFDSGFEILVLISYILQQGGPGKIRGEK